MKPLKIVSTIAFTLLVLMIMLSQAHAASPVVGDIILRGDVLRSGQRLANDSSIFEGDTIRTQKAAAGIIRIGRGRLEVDESSEVEIVTGKPLKIIVKSGNIAYNFPPGTDFEIITPQLEVRPNLSATNLSGQVSAQPQKEDRVVSRSGNYRILEREPNGETNHIGDGQMLVASLVPTVPVSMEMPAALQGQLGGPQIASITAFSGDVRLARAATPRNEARITQIGTGLATNDLVKTLVGGNADVTFTDNSIVTLTPGTTIVIQQQQTPTGVTRRIQQFIGNMWFNIQRVTGTETTLQTPTAVAAIRGTQGAQEVPNDFQSTHALNEGIQEITELVTQQTVTIRDGQRVTAIRGIGFTPIVALLAAIPRPGVGVGGGGGAAGTGAAPGAAPGAAAGAGAGAATATASTAATTAVTSTVSTVTAALVPAATGVVSALPATIAANQDTRSASASVPLLPPGGSGGQ